ncbi:hypothetical protein ACFQH8_10680 [Halomicroarcula sp. GCM10025710]
MAPQRVDHPGVLLAAVVRGGDAQTVPRASAPDGRRGELERATGPVPVEEAAETEPAVELAHDEYDPKGTAALVAFYFVLIALLWVFMYFVEFLGRVSVIG